VCSGVQLEQGRCRKCGKRKSSELPEGVTSDTFGPRVKSIIAALSGFYKNSKRGVASIINDIFNLDISVGSISNSEHRVSSKCQKMYEQVEQEVSNSKVFAYRRNQSLQKRKIWLVLDVYKRYGEFCKINRVERNGSFTK
jgi:hypothetical protein